jgi:hypothetical protein
MEISWSRLDDYQFVHLVADLLRGLGFQDVAVQGDGPDGGLDLIATEPLRYAIQGVQPFRWGIQCKFSSDGQHRSVSDREVRDVEGILRSDRFSPLALNGYMVVTNRRISQNVVERLRGIGRNSQFRTAVLDGAQLESRLRDHPEILNRYLGDLSEVLQDLGTPVVESLADSQGRFSIEVLIAVPGSTESCVVSAVIDTGAVVSCIPSAIIDRLGRSSVLAGQAYARLATGNRVEVSTCTVDITIGNVTWQNHFVVEIDRESALLGQDILSGTILMLEGASQRLRLWRA